MIRKYGTVEQDEVKIDKEFKMQAQHIMLPNYQRRIWQEQPKQDTPQGE